MIVYYSPSLLLIGGFFPGSGGVGAVGVYLAGVRKSIKKKEKLRLSPGSINAIDLFFPPPPTHTHTHGGEGTGIGLADWRSTVSKAGYEGEGGGGGVGRGLPLPCLPLQTA